MCIKEGTTCYLIFCGQNDWFAAKELCQGEAAELAILPNNKKLIMKLAKNIEELPNQCTNFWIGISTFAWLDRKGKFTSLHGILFSSNAFLPN